MAITRYDPFRELEDLMGGMVLKPVRVRGEQGEVSIKIDASEDSEAYRITAEIPGVKREDINIAVDGNAVTISAEVRRDKEEKEGGRLLRSERYFGQVSRSFTLPTAVDETAAQAKYESGVLRLTLPKRDSSRYRKIMVT